MTVDENTPVLVGVGALNQCEEDPSLALEAVGLMEGALRRAAADAGTDELLRRASSIRVTNGIWDYPDPGRILAERVGATRARTDLVEVGILQTTLLGDAARAIAAGEEKVVVVVGGEAKFRSLRAAITDTQLENTSQPQGTKPDRFLEPAKEILNPLELELGLGMPVNQYALLESAFRHATGESVEENRRALGCLYAGMNKVAVANEDAWNRTAVRAEEISGVSANNRMLAFPYTKRQNSQWNVDQAACLILTSLQVARELGIGEDRFVFPLAVAESNHMVSLVERGALDRSFGFHHAGRRALAAAGLAIEEVAYLELYSCFPVAVRAQMRELGIPAGRRITETGGMAFAGGPLNNFVYQALVKMVQTLRADPGSTGLVSAVSGMLTKQGVSLWSSVAPDTPFAFDDVSEEVAAEMPVHVVVRDYKGPAKIAAATVQYVGGDAVATVLVCDLPGGGRTLIRSTDEALMRRVTEAEVCGLSVEISPAGPVLAAAPAASGA